MVQLRIIMLAASECRNACVWTNLPKEYRSSKGIDFNSFYEDGPKLPRAAIY